MILEVRRLSVLGFDELLYCWKGRVVYIKAAICYGAPSVLYCTSVILGGLCRYRRQGLIFTEPGKRLWKELTGVST